MTLSPEEELQKEKSKKITTFVSAGCLVIVISIVGFFAMAYYFDRSKEIPVGTEVILHSEEKLVPVFLDIQALMQYERDMGSLPYLTYHNRAVMVDSGTKARIEKSGSNSVRILEGKHAGKTGYIIENEIVYTKSKKQE